MSQNTENITFSKEIGTRIGLLRASNNNETQQSLADAMGVSREIIQHWESGKRHIKADAIIKLAQHFNVSADYLLGLYDEKEPKQDIRAIHEYTGLSPEVIELLNLANLNSTDPERLRGLSSFLCVLLNWGFDHYLDMYANAFLTARLLNCIRANIFDYLCSDFSDLDTLSENASIMIHMALKDAIVQLIPWIKEAKELTSMQKQMLTHEIKRNFDCSFEDLPSDILDIDLKSLSLTDLLKYKVSNHFEDCLRDYVYDNTEKDSFFSLYQGIDSIVASYLTAHRDELEAIKAAAKADSEKEVAHDEA